MSECRKSLDEAKRRLPLPELLNQLGLGEHARRSARCPLHEDHSPSFSIWEADSGWRWKCHKGCGGGDEVSFMKIYLGVPDGDAIRSFCEMAGGQPAPMAGSRVIKPLCSLRRPTMPDDASPGTEADWRALAAKRGLWWAAPAKAAELGTLFFGTVCGHWCWILTDERRLCAEARRMDGKLFPSFGEVRERKAHTIRGSVKSWPVGLAVRRFHISDFRAVMIVEGGPDYIAALHFVLRGTSDCLPIAFLGAGTASSIHPDAHALLLGRRGRFYQHADTSGNEAVRRWAAQLQTQEKAIDAFRFDGLRKMDGSSVKDLNDCVFIHPDDAWQLGGLLP